MFLGRCATEDSNKRGLHTDALTLKSTVVWIGSYSAARCCINISLRFIMQLQFYGPPIM